MTDPSARPDDLGTLAAQAEQAAVAHAAGAAMAGDQAQAARARRARHLRWGLVLWLAAAALWAWQLRAQLMHGSLARDDLAALMAQARDEVNAAWKAQGQLPAALPSPALAVAIRYEVVDATANPPVYRLEGELGPARQTWTNAR